MNEPPDRPLNVPPPETPIEDPPEGWYRVWIPVTLALIVGLGLAMRSILATGTPWAECQLRYIEATSGRDSAAIDTLRPGPDGDHTCGGLRIERS
ncbi:MAG: hypothetical protein RQ745_03120 [Longimicrobiales bacterium]|nr:hypothetical protein [Longimicrobiales bacterium]